MKNRQINEFWLKTEGQATVMFSILILLMIAVGLTVMQVGRGAEQRIQFRLTSNTSCYAVAASYGAQYAPVAQTGLMHEYILLASYLGDMLHTLHEAGVCINESIDNHDEISVLLASPAFGALLSTYQTKMSTITNNPENPGLIPSTFEEDSRANLIRNALIAGQFVVNANQAESNHLSHMEQLIFPDSFLWSETPLSHPARGFFVISEMPSPHFFFLNAFPYSRISRRGRMIAVSYAPLTQNHEIGLVESSLVKNTFNDILAQLKTCNELNQDRLMQMKLLNSEDYPEDEAILIQYWNDILQEYKTWAEDTIASNIFADLSLFQGAPIQPIYASWMNALSHESELINSIAVSKGIPTSDPQMMIESLGGILALGDLFADGTMDPPVQVFSNRLLDYHEALLEENFLPESDLIYAFGQLDAFNDLNAQNIPLLLQQMHISLEGTPSGEMASLSQLILSFSEQLPFFYEGVSATVDMWAELSQAPLDALVFPSPQFFDFATDFFNILLVRLESN